MLAVRAVLPLPGPRAQAADRDEPARREWAKIESRKDIKVTIEVGARFGRTAPLLSRLTAAWEETVPAAGSPESASREALRAKGFGTVFGEYRPELNVVGFPVFDREGYPCLLITLLGIGADLTPRDVEELAEYLVVAGRAITARSGGRVPADYPGPLRRRPLAESGGSAYQSRPVQRCWMVDAIACFTTSASASVIASNASR